MILLINITNQDIAKGVPAHRLYCPIAIAVKRALRQKGYSEFNVATSEKVTIIASQHEHFHAEHKPEIIEWIKSFDDGFINRCSPISTTLSFIATKAMLC